MDTLKTYLNTLPVKEQIDLALRCGTTLSYLRKAISIKQRLGESLVIKIERETNGAVRCESLRDDVDWGYLRTSRPIHPSVQQDQP